MSGRINSQLSLDVAELALDALDVGGNADDCATANAWLELALDLHAIVEHARDEVAAFHRTHDVTRAAAPAPAWWMKGGAA